MQLKKKEIYILLLLIASNVLTYMVLLPYAQNTANSHMNAGSFLAAAYYLMAGLLVVVALRTLFRNEKGKVFVLLIFFALSLTVWAYRLQTLQCLGCLHSG